MTSTESIRLCSGVDFTKQTMLSLRSDKNHSFELRWKTRRHDLSSQLCTQLKVDGTSFQVFWICRLWKERSKNQLNIITKFVYDSIANLFSSKNDNYFVTICYHGNDTWWLFRPTFELRTLISWKLTWWPPIFFTLVSLSFENETTWSFKKISTKRIFYKR